MLSRRSGAAHLFILTILFMAFSLHRQAFGYIDPGTTQVIWTTLAPILGFLGICFFAAIWPIRIAWRFVHSHWEKWSWLSKGAVLLGCAVALFAIVYGGVVFFSPEEEATPKIIGPLAESDFKGTIVLGIDGLDPKVLSRMMDEGSLPNFSRLRERGAFAPLQTSMPPQSPVAWTTAATGVNPGRHGLFDYVARDPETYRTKTSLLRLKERSLLKPTDQPFGSTVDRPAFWDILSQHGVKVSVIRWPMTFPPHAVNGHMLSGLGTPDVTGKMETYMFYTTEPVRPEVASMLSIRSVSWNGDIIETEHPGPMKSSGGDVVPSTVPLRIERMNHGQSLRVTLGKADPVTLRPAQWSDWIRISFPMGLARSCPAEVKLYLSWLTPELGLYVGSCQVDPLDPAFPVTYPASFSKELAKEIGSYHTLGMPEEHKGSALGVIPAVHFLDKCNQVTADRERMLDYELERFDGGLLAIVFASNDRISHLFWPAVDPSHPMHAECVEGGFENVISTHYRQMDAMLGKVLDAAKDDVAVIVMSDHGFASSLYHVNVNSWLKENGYMVTASAEGNAGAPAHSRTDWSRTKAYSVGFNGVYLNVQGREAQGIVSEGAEYQQLREEIIQKLKAWIHPKTGKPIMRNVYARDEVYRGPYLNDAPDIVLGFYPEYTTGLDAAAEVRPDDVVEESGPWPGNHMVDPASVPGVFMSNFEINTERPSLIDICPTVLRCFNVPAPHDTDGKPLF